jgi:hypothetical protein
LRYYRCHLLIAEEDMNGPHSGVEICDTVKQFYPETECLLISKSEAERIDSKSASPQQKRYPTAQRPTQKSTFSETLNSIFGGLQHAY